MRMFMVMSKCNVIVMTAGALNRGVRCAFGCDRQATGSDSCVIQESDQLYRQWPLVHFDTHGSPANHKHRLACLIIAAESTGFHFEPLTSSSFPDLVCVIRVTCCPVTRTGTSGWEFIIWSMSIRVITFFFWCTDTQGLYLSPSFLHLENSLYSFCLVSLVLWCIALWSVRQLGQGPETTQSTQ